MMFVIALSAIASASPFGGSPFGPGGGVMEIHLMDAQPAADPVDFNALADVLPLLDVLTQPMMKAPHQEIDPLLPLLLAGMDDPGANPLHGPREPAGSDLDPFTLEMLQRMGLGLAAPVKKPDACDADTKKWCAKKEDQKTTVLHCLSDHHNDLSKECYNRIKNTLPHVCSSEIDKMCDTISEGVLACLERNIAKLKGKCLDAYAATRHTVDAVKSSSQVTIVDKFSGKIQTLWTNMNNLETNMSSNFKAILGGVGATLQFWVLLLAGATVCMALYWHAAENALRRGPMIAEEMKGKANIQLSNCEYGSLESGNGSNGPVSLAL
jgi:hypothetical protein